MGSVARSIAAPTPALEGVVIEDRTRVAVAGAVLPTANRLGRATGAKDDGGAGKRGGVGAVRGTRTL